MKLLMAYLVLAVISQAQRSMLRSPQDVTQGREIYNRSCTMCHGLDGAVGDRAPALGAARRYLRNSEQDLFDAIKKGIPGTAMPPSPMPDGHIWKIVGFIRSLRATASDSFVRGDAASGEKIFWGKGGCGDCHTLGGKGGLLGPDLSNTGGERSLSYLRDSLTTPRPHIPQGYRPVTVTTSDGRTIEGIIRNENNFSAQMLGQDAKLHLLTRHEIREIVYAKQSLMPSDYDKRLSPAELQDLLAFLSRQARSKGSSRQRGENRKS